MPTRIALICFFLLLALGCQQKEQLPVNDSFFEAGVVQGELHTKELREASGLAASVGNPDLLWVHNDGGDKARIFLIDKHANFLSTVWLADIKHRDWEDMAIGPGPEEGKNYVYVGDIGDNDAKHKYKFIYRLEEPVADWSKTPDTTVTNIKTIKFQMPDGSRDAESMMIDPVTRDIFIISKREQKVNLYRLPYPQSTTEEMTAELVLSKLEFNQFEEKITSEKNGEKLTNGYHAAYYNQVVSCDISPDGSEVLVKSYSSVYYWKREKNERIADVIKRIPFRLPYSPEPQGEAIAFDVKGAGYFTLNEELGKNPQQLIFYKRK
jgi:hypothetical protein